MKDEARGLENPFAKYPLCTISHAIYRHTTEPRIRAIVPITARNVGAAKAEHLPNIISERFSLVETSPQYCVRLAPLDPIEELRVKSLTDPLSAFKMEILEDLPFLLDYLPADRQAPQKRPFLSQTLPVLVGANSRSSNTRFPASFSRQLTKFKYDITDSGGHQLYPDFPVIMQELLSNVIPVLLTDHTQVSTTLNILPGGIMLSPAGTLSILLVQIMFTRPTINSDPTATLPKSMLAFKFSEYAVNLSDDVWLYRNGVDHSLLQSIVSATECPDDTKLTHREHSLPQDALASLLGYSSMPW